MWKLRNTTNEHGLGWNREADQETDLTIENKLMVAQGEVVVVVVVVVGKWV